MDYVDPVDVFDIFIYLELANHIPGNEQHNGDAHRKAQDIDH